MKSILLLAFIFSSLTSFANNNRMITSDVQVEFSCVIPGHGGGCSVETYFFNAHPEAHVIKVFTSFIEDGKVQMIEVETLNTKFINLYTSKNEGYIQENSIRIGTDETLLNVMFFDANGYLIDSRKEVLRVSFTEEY